MSDITHVLNAATQDQFCLARIAFSTSGHKNQFPIDSVNP